MSLLPEGLSGARTGASIANAPSPPLRLTSSAQSGAAALALALGVTP